MGDPCMVVPAGPDRDACYATAPSSPGMPPMGMPSTSAQPVLPPTGGMPTTAIPPTDPCMAVTDANDRAACKASHQAPSMPPMGMPSTGMHPPMGQPGMPPMGAPMCFDPARGQIPCSEMPGANPNMIPPVSNFPVGSHGGMPPGTMPPMGDPCMVVPAGPDRDACYATAPSSPGMPPMGAPGAAAMPSMGGDPCRAITDPNDLLACTASLPR